MNREARGPTLPPPRHGTRAGGVEGARCEGVAMAGRDGVQPRPDGAEGWSRTVGEGDRAPGGVRLVFLGEPQRFFLPQSQRHHLKMGAKWPKCCIHTHLAYLPNVT